MGNWPERPSCAIDQIWKKSKLWSSISDRLPNLSFHVLLFWFQGHFVKLKIICRIAFSFVSAWEMSTICSITIVRSLFRLLMRNILVYWIGMLFILDECRLSLMENKLISSIWVYQCFCIIIRFYALWYPKAELHRHFYILLISFQIRTFYSF